MYYLYLCKSELHTYKVIWKMYKIEQLKLGLKKLKG